VICLAGYSGLMGLCRLIQGNNGRMGLVLHHQRHSGCVAGLSRGMHVPPGVMVGKGVLWCLIRAVFDERQTPRRDREGQVLPALVLHVVQVLAFASE
jgi:hypothetical protein